jgi:hypothetical protein
MVYWDDEDCGPDFREQKYVLWSIKQDVDSGVSLWDLDGEWYWSLRELWYMVYLPNCTDDYFTGTAEEEAEYLAECTDLDYIPF